MAPHYDSSVVMRHPTYACFEDQSLSTNSPSVLLYSLQKGPKDAGCAGALHDNKLESQGGTLNTNSSSGLIGTARDSHH